MTDHLLLITLGPVQDFIAQARRTRDLWYGSHLLSELGRAAARTLVDEGADLVFPALKKGDRELHACVAPLRSDGTQALNIANKILAEVPYGLDPEALAQSVRTEVMRHWRDDLAAPVKTRCAGLLAASTDAVWTEQVDTLVEFGASWAPLGDYGATRREIEGALLARKCLRDFGPWVHDRGNVPKSSLDGARETVLRPPQKRESRLVRKYRIAEGEQLDAVGLVKRAGGKPDQFVPIVNVALASWMELASAAAAEEVEVLREACRKDIPRVTRTDLPCVRPFPFDASVFLPNRWRPVFEELGREDSPQDWGRRHVSPILAKLSEPYPYVACLVADGDRMGRAIDRLAEQETPKTSPSQDDSHQSRAVDGPSSAGKHRAISRALSHFAGQARNVVEQEHRGALVYAGGDDVLAFVPLPCALACAEQLRNRFKEAMAAACARLPPSEQPTLSVGIGIGHVLDGMGDLLALGREAEREAKIDRNALAVIVDKRSGGRCSWRSSWDLDPVQLLRESTVLLEERLSSRKVFEIASILARLPQPRVSDDSRWARLLALEVRRSLSRVEGGLLSPESAGLVLDAGTDYETLHADVTLWLERLLIARTFLKSTPRERGHGREVAA